MKFSNALDFQFYIYDFLEVQGINTNEGLEEVGKELYKQLDIALSTYAQKNNLDDEMFLNRNKGNRNKGE